MSTLQTRSTDSAAHQHLYDVFMSHQSGDKSLVESIATRLVDEQGLRPFLDKWHLIPGEPWQEALEEALDRSKTCAVFLGPGGLGPWENEEMRAAIEERVRNKSFRVIPVLLPGAEPKNEKTLPRFLRRLTWVDFRGGLDDPDTFQRLVAGIRGVAPGPQSAQTTSAINPDRTGWRTTGRLRDVFSSIFASKGMSRVETWKIVLPAVLTLLLSTPFIGAAIPRYKLQIKSPAFRKEGVYEAPAGMVLIKWGMTKEQWFRETDVSDVGANLVISKSGGEVEVSFQNQPGEARASLNPGRYEVRIDAVAYQRTETIALQVTTPAQGAATETATLTGTVIEPDGNPIQGAKVTIDEIPGMTPVETSTDGVFIIKEIPKSYGEGVRINVIKEGYQPYTEDVVLGKTPPKVKLRRKR
jgi:TIR domain